MYIRKKTYDENCILIADEHVERVLGRTEGERRVWQMLTQFPMSGIDEKQDRWWAREAGSTSRRFVWSLEQDAQ